MPFASYLRHGLWDLLLCAICSSSLVFVLCTGFFATRGMQGFPAVAVLVAACTVLSVVLFCVAFSAQTAVIGSIALVVVFGIAAVASVALGTASAIFADEPGNYLICLLVIVLPTVFVFVLSRRRSGIVALLVTGVFACALVEYLYWFHYVLPLALFALSAIALFVYRAYQKTLLSAEAGSMSFSAVCAAGVVMSAAAFLIGFGVYTVGIAPLNPPNFVVKLVTEYYRIDTEEVRGVGDAQLIQDNQLFTSVTNEQIQEGTFEQNEQTTKPDDEPEGGAGDEGKDSSSSESLDDDSQNESGNPITTLLREYWFVFAPILVVLIAGGSILAKRLLRKRRFDAMVAQGREGQVAELYNFFIARFGKMGIQRGSGQTLREFAAGENTAIAAFEAEQNTPAFAELTDVFMDVTYGAHGADESECGLFKAYYAAFYRNMCRYLGRLRYALKFFFV